MTNVGMLTRAISAKGLKMGFIAEQLGITRQGLNQKLSTGSDFSVKQADKLRDLLDLSESDFREIFLL